MVELRYCSLCRRWIKTQVELGIVCIEMKTTIESLDNLFTRLYAEKGTIMTSSLGSFTSATLTKENVFISYVFVSLVHHFRIFYVKDKVDVYLHITDLFSNVTDVTA